ncbi:MAG TPA: SMI1/KNR4 family protein [Phototrophicaceae bacterium]|nr:SMI1/KNR4 family protein [Phototrophicaceae bacterium]
MDWQQWQFQIEQQISKLKDLETTFHEADNRLLPATKQTSLVQLETKLGRSLPSDFIEFYQRFDGLRLPDVWNSYFVDTVEQILRVPSPSQLESPRYNGRMLIFGSDSGGNHFCIFFGAESQPVLYLPNTLWEQDRCLYEAIGGLYLSPKWLAADFSGFFQRILDDTKAFIRNDADWKYMDHDLYRQKSL